MDATPAQEAACERVSPVQADSVFSERVDADFEECFVVFLCACGWLTSHNCALIETVNFFPWSNIQKLGTQACPHTALWGSEHHDQQPARQNRHFTQFSFSHCFSILTLPPHQRHRFLWPVMICFVSEGHLLTGVLSGKLSCDLRTLRDFVVKQVEMEQSCSFQTLIVSSKSLETTPNRPLSLAY